MSVSMHAAMKMTKIRTKYFNSFLFIRCDNAPSVFERIKVLKKIM